MTNPTLISCAALLWLGSSASATATDLSTSWDDGIEVEWAKRREINLGSRVHWDVTRASSGVTELTGGDGFRRARVELGARFDDWRVRADYELGLVPGWRNLFVEYRGLRRHRFTIGHQVAPISLDDLMSSNDLTFMERSLASALSPGMLLGARWQTWGDHWTMAAGVFGNELNDQDRRSMRGASVIGRATYAPIRNRGRVLHFGIAQDLRRVSDGERLRLRSRPEAFLAGDRLVSTQRLDDIDTGATTALELIAIRNNFRLQGEYMRMSLQGGPEADTFDGGYVQLSWVPTGERYRYSQRQGYSTGIRPRGRFGALELSTRLSTVDLEEGIVTGGEQRQWTTGLSWYAKRRYRVMLNYGRFSATPNRNGVEESGSLVSLRLQAAM